jgi:DNA-directed RNA polymerase subunit H (RpoH/RPB5)
MTQRNEVVEIFKSRKTILELLEIQGYDTSNYNKDSMSQVSIMLQNEQLDMLVEKDGKKAYVKYHLGKTLRAANVLEYIEDLHDLEKVLEKTDDLIIIMREEPNDSLIKELKNIWEKDRVFVIVHAMKRLQFNIMNHELVPPHRNLNEKEVVEFKNKYKITDDNLIPDINRFSPVALALCMRPGEICEIIRPSNTSIETPFYRVCSP